MSIFSTILLITGGLYGVLSGVGILLPKGKVKTAIQGLALDIGKVLSVLPKV